jgi:hypothetical protein
MDYLVDILNDMNPVLINCVYFSFFSLAVRPDMYKNLGLGICVCFRCWNFQFKGGVANLAANITIESSAGHLRSSQQTQTSQSQRCPSPRPS